MAMELTNGGCLETIGKAICAVAVSMFIPVPAVAVTVTVTPFGL